MREESQEEAARQRDALVEMMVIGANLSGGLGPERVDTLLTVMLEHERFTGLEEVELRALLTEARERAEVARLPLLAAHLVGLERLAMQLTLLVAGGADALEPAASALRLSDEAVAEIVAAGIPPELDILSTDPSPEETYLDVLLAAAAADGHLAPEELEALVQYASSRLELRLLPRPEIEDLMTVSLQAFLDYGVQDWLEGLPEALPEEEQRKTAYRLAAEMIAADNVIHKDELRFIEALRDSLGLDPLWAASVTAQGSG